MSKASITPEKPTTPTSPCWVQIEAGNISELDGDIATSTWAMNVHGVGCLVRTHTTTRSRITEMGVVVGRKVQPPTETVTMVPGVYYEDGEFVPIVDPREAARVVMASGGARGRAQANSEDDDARTIALLVESMIDARVRHPVNTRVDDVLVGIKAPDRMRLAFLVTAMTKSDPPRVEVHSEQFTLDGGLVFGGDARRAMERAAVEIIAWVRGLGEEAEEPAGDPKDIHEALKLSRRRNEIVTLDPGFSARSGFNFNEATVISLKQVWATDRTVVTVLDTDNISDTREFDNSKDNIADGNEIFLWLEALSREGFGT